MNNPWEAIKPPAEDISARRVDHSHLLDLFWARDQQGRYLFVCAMKSSRKVYSIQLPELVGIQALQTMEGGVSKLILILTDQNNWELFAGICNDLIETTRRANNNIQAIEIIQRRLLQWHEFLKQVRPRMLSEEQIKGLIGELIFLRDHVIPKFGAAVALKYWKGPEGAPQDFNIGDSVIEVKCQSGATAPRIVISSADQLSPQLPMMYLFVVTLGAVGVSDAGAINLPSLTGEITALLNHTAPESLEQFNNLLCKSGYIPAERYLEYSYLLANKRLFLVREHFPRIAVKQVPAGVSRLTYSIDLSACDPFEITLKEWEAYYG